MFKLGFFSLALVISYVYRCVSFFCTDYPGELDNNFNLELFSGKWHTYSKWSPHIGEECIYLDVQCVNETSATIIFRTNPFRFNFPLEVCLVSHGDLVGKAQATIQDTNMKRKLHLDYEKETTMMIGNWEPTMFIPATDYKNYAIVWICEDLTPARIFTECIWILTRKMILDNSTEDDALRAEMWSQVLKYSGGANHTFVDIYDSYCHWVIPGLLYHVMHGDNGSFYNLLQFELPHYYEQRVCTDYAYPSGPLMEPTTGSGF